MRMVRRDSANAASLVTVPKLIAPLMSSCAAAIMRCSNRTLESLRPESSYPRQTKIKFMQHVHTAWNVPHTRMNEEYQIAVITELEGPMLLMENCSKEGLLHSPSIV